MASRINQFNLEKIHSDLLDYFVVQFKEKANAES